jgi:hypothetical protein
MDDRAATIGRVAEPAGVNRAAGIGDDRGSR